jgi:putative tryptophan/tyrosine transport system permease protein
MELWIGALNLGFLYAFMTMGVFITFRVHDFPDITVDGSFTSGAATAAILIVSGYNPFIAISAAFVVGAIAGSITALINTRFQIDGLLSGILVMTGLYSINLHIMGRSNVPLLNQKTFVTYLAMFNPGLPLEIWTGLIMCCIMAVFWLLISLFFKTDLGIAMRITGNNPTMAAANGVNVGLMTIFGVAIANGFVGVSGGLVAQYQGFADISMGIGTIVIGLAGVIIGESVFRIRSMWAKILSVIIGSVIFRFMIAVALFVGMNPIDLKLLMALFVLVVLIISKNITDKNNNQKSFLERVKTVFTVKKIIIIIFVFIIAGVYVSQENSEDQKDTLQNSAYISSDLTQDKSSQTASAVGSDRQGKSDNTDNIKVLAPEKRKKVGVVQFAMEPNVEICKTGIVKSLAEKGFIVDKNIDIIYKNAQADFSLINSIIQDLIRRKVDVIVPLSTPCVQSSLQFVGKSKKTTIVFTYVFDPYIIGAAKTPDDHLPNLTGVSCFPPVLEILDLIKEMFPERKKIGIVWNSSEANSEAVIKKIRVHAKKIGLSIIEVTVTNSSEVLEASRSCIIKGADVFLNPGDNTLNVSFDSFASTAARKGIPVFSVDSELIHNGAFVTLGPDYYQTGYDGGRYIAR